ncbi:Spermatogenesis-associated protein 16 [Varanus komodoensis]|nr:Spermatogenesis-associated protein 16 [Varanus komodoensis]
MAAHYEDTPMSTMVADYMYWLSGGRETQTSKLIKLYWQGDCNQELEEQQMEEVEKTIEYKAILLETKSKIILMHVFPITIYGCQKNNLLVPMTYDEGNACCVLPKARKAMIEEAITRAECFSVMYTPFATKVKTIKIDKLKEAFTKKHPDYVEYIYTDPHGLHSLPQTADWSFPSPQSYLLTLGFKNKEVGKFLEKMSCRKLPTFSEHKAPFSPLTKEEAGRHLETIGKRILPIMDFIRGTKLTESKAAYKVLLHSILSSQQQHCKLGVIEKLQHASLLGRLQRIKEQSQVINQAMADLATIPYLQDISQQDAELLQSLMADAMDTLEGRKSDKERVWNKIQKDNPMHIYLEQSSKQKGHLLTLYGVQFLILVGSQTCLLPTYELINSAVPYIMRFKTTLMKEQHFQWLPSSSSCNGCPTAETLLHKTKAGIEQLEETQRSKISTPVGIIEDFLYQIEDSFLKTKKLRTARRQKMKMKRLQSEQPC